MQIVVPSALIHLIHSLRLPHPCDPRTFRTKTQRKRRLTRLIGTYYSYVRAKNRRRNLSPLNERKQPCREHPSPHHGMHGVDPTQIINIKDEQVAAGTSNFKGQRMGALPKQSLGTEMGHFVSDDPYLLWFCNPLHDRC